MVIVALVSKLETQVPPEVGESVAVEPTQIELGAVTVGTLLIVTFDVVLAHPVEF